MSVVDASVWISYLLWEDEHHEETRTWIRQGEIFPGRFVAPSLLLIEIAGAVARRTGRADVALRLVARLKSTAGLQFYPFDEPHADEYVHLAADLRMRAADVVYVKLARNLGLPLISWDRQQRERAAEVVTVLTPTEALARGLT